MDPNEVDVNKITYYDANGNPIKGDGTSGSGSGSGWLAGLLGAIPGILSSLFPSGIGGGNNQGGYVSTSPNGNTSVNLGSNNNNILMIVLVAMVAYLIFTDKSPVRAKR